MLDKFKTNIEDNWKGEKKSKNLFEIWRKSIQKTNEHTISFVTPTKNLNALTFITPISFEDSYVHDPCTSTASCSQENILIGSEEKRQEILVNKISPMTSGKDVPSPFKRNLLWPKSPKKKTSIPSHRLRMPFVVTSGQYDKYEEKKQKSRK